MLKKVLTSLFVAVLVVAGGTAAYAQLDTSPAATQPAAADTAAAVPATGSEVAAPAVNAPAADSQTQAHDPAQEIAALPVEDLSAAEEAALRYMYEEEKLARDVYQALYGVWGAATFQNIAASEQMHMDAVYALIDRYGLDVPTLAAGEFANADLQALYNELTARGSQSLAEAFKTGGAIEEIDILDLRERLAQTDNADIQQVFTSLMNGSANHLASFANALENQTGEIYQPQFLSLEDYQQVVASAQSNTDHGNGNTQNQGAVTGNGAAAQNTANGYAASHSESEIHGTVSAYDFGLLTLVTDAGETLTVQLPNPNYVASLGFAPLPGDGLTLVGSENANGEFMVSVIITDDGQTFTFRSSGGGPPAWAGGNGGGH